MLMEKIHEFGQIILREIICPHPRIEPRHPEIDRVGPIGDSGTGTLPVSRWSEQFSIWMRQHFPQPST
jgi:hypothetical protein